MIRMIHLLRSRSGILCFVSLFVAGSTTTRHGADGYVVRSPDAVMQQKLRIPGYEPSTAEDTSTQYTSAAEEMEQDDAFPLTHHHRPLMERNSVLNESTIPVASPPPRNAGGSTMPGLPTAAAATTTTTAVLSPLESWCLSKLDRWYGQSQSAKCPFLRRRSGDVLDTLEGVVRHTVIRRECWPLMGPPQAHRPAGSNRKLNRIKRRGSTLGEIRDRILDDWKVETGKGYYVTGKLTTSIYRDDCWFLGPDPDMPIHGLRKYVGVAAHLFDYDASFATLDSLRIIVPDDDDHHHDDNGGGDDDDDDDDVSSSSAAGRKLVATWTLGGILRLPWKPSLPTFSGRTVYHVDADGLIESHEESWDCSVMRAFCHTLFPKLADRIWPDEDGGGGSGAS
jgi:Uncharacterized conserved protein (DUF2358)